MKNKYRILIFALVFSSTLISAQNAPASQDESAFQGSSALKADELKALQQEIINLKKKIQERQLQQEKLRQSLADLEIKIKEITHKIKLIAPELESKLK